jgi:hypothetical protein
MSHKDGINKLIIEHQRRLQKLEEQKAKLGIYTPPQILIEIEDIKAEIEWLQAELESLLEDSGNHRTSQKGNMLIRKEALVTRLTDEKLNFLTGLDSIRGILSDFDRIDLLGEKPVAKLCIVEVKRREKNYGDSSKGRGLALKEILNQAIETLKPKGPSPQWAEGFINDLMVLNLSLSSSIEGTDGAWQEYLVLKLTTSGTPRKIAADLLSISVRNAHNRFNNAANKVGNMLYQWEQDCKNISSLPDNGDIYVERKADNDLKQWITNWNRNEHLAITIRGPRETGKTTLLQLSGVGYAGQQGIKVVPIDLNEFGIHYLAESYDYFLRELARLIARKIELDLNIEEIWEEPRFSGGSPTTKLTWLMEDHILPTIKQQAMILALDEADLLMLHSSHYEDFFSMLRSWYNKGSNPNLPLWKKFGLILAISTEPHLLIENPHKSPFNVGYRIYLEDFDKESVLELNQNYVQRYGLSPATEAEIDEMMGLLGGHPALTRKVLDALANNEQTSWANIAQHAVNVNSSLFSTHLHEVFGPLRDHAELKDVFKQILEIEDSPDKLSDKIFRFLRLNRFGQGNTIDDQALFRLNRAGLVRRKGGSYECRNKLYESYFRNTF